MAVPCEADDCQFTLFFRLVCSNEAGRPVSSCASFACRERWGTEDRRRRWRPGLPGLQSRSSSGSLTALLTQTPSAWRARHNASPQRTATTPRRAAKLTHRPSLPAARSMVPACYRNVDRRTCLAPSRHPLEGRRHRPEHHTPPGAGALRCAIQALFGACYRRLSYLPIFTYIKVI
ncbi:unnamed protein product [Laminaria digitata]